MKKALLVALLAVSVLAGCEQGFEDGHTTDDGRFKAVGDVGDYDLIRDKETGCLYTESHRRTSSLTPFYDKDGKVAGCGQKEVKGGDFE